MDNGLILYYNTPHTDRVGKIMMKVVPVKLIGVVISACYISPLLGHIHEQITLFRILAHF